MERSTPNQSILDAPTGTNQANGSRLDAVPSHPFSIYKTGLAYNEKHYLPPGHITLPAAPNGGVIECGAEEWSNYTNSIFTLEDHLSWQSEEINHRRALVWDKIPRHHLIMGDKEPNRENNRTWPPSRGFWVCVCVCVCFPVCVCVCIGSKALTVLCVHVWGLYDTAADLLPSPPPSRQRVPGFSSVTLWRVSVSLPWCCLVPDKQTHMTDVNTIPTSPAACLLLPDTPNTQALQSAAPQHGRLHAAQVLADGAGWVQDLTNNSLVFFRLPIITITLCPLRGG